MKHEQRSRLVAVIAVSFLQFFNFEELAATAPTDPSANTYEHATVLVEAGRRDEAARVLRVAGAADTADGPLLLKIGLAQSKLQDWTGAIQTYQRLLQQEPRNSLALHNLGNVYFRQDRYEEAARFYQRAVEADPDYVLALYHHGWVLRQLNRNLEAEAAFRRCAAVKPKSGRDQSTQVDCQFYLGTLRFRGEDYAAAATLLEQVLAVHPGHLEAHHYLGTAYLRLGRAEDGRRELETHREMLRARRRADPIERRNTMGDDPMTPE